MQIDSAACQWIREHRGFEFVTTFRDILASCSAGKVAIVRLTAKEGRLSIGINVANIALVREIMGPTLRHPGIPGPVELESESP